jgi:hypothetical protein
MNSVEELNTETSELLPLFSKTTEGSRLLVSPQYPNGMRIERNNNTRKGLSNIVERRNHMTVTEMHPIEISKGNHSALKA